MSQFALPPDERQIKEAQRKKAEEAAASTKISPERECVHRMIFAGVLYVSLLATVLVLVPTIGSAFDTRAAVPGPDDATGIVARIWFSLDAVIVVRRIPRAVSLLTAFKVERLGPLWPVLLAFPALIGAIQLRVADKALAGRLHMRATAVMATLLVAVVLAAMADMLLAFLQES